ncbi:TetR/AcrR family transcriptional regulator [Aquihabitans daechungensis]|uniref:TetR/AcrR family transcriptional regulator n=1 Tax=Aquihabitans daechungensis TaxID=1052257 RepID=UPI003BA2898D
MPKLWEDTIEVHRSAVRTVILDQTAALAMEHGLASVTMSQIAAAAGIGRATLYKYFPDVDSILLAWHEQQLNAHLAQLQQARDREQGAAAQLQVVLEAFAHIARGAHGHQGTDLGAFLHGDDHVARAQQELRDLISELLARGAEVGEIRSDVYSDELADYCIHALGAAGRMKSKAAVDRLVDVTMAGLRPDR